MASRHQPDVVQERRAGRATPLRGLRELLKVTAQLTLLPELEPDDDSGTVYFLTDLRLIKVGYTGRSRPDCLKQRSGELRGHIIGWLPGTEDDERAYQAPLARWNCGGEWFSWRKRQDAGRMMVGVWSEE